MERAEGSCFHCGESIPNGTNLGVNVDGNIRPVCCVGCQAVAQLIFGTGLGRYYQFRQELGRQADEDIQSEIAAWRSCDDRETLWGLSLIHI